MYKTVPTIFKQSCTIHRRIDGDDRDGNSQIMSLVFALMSSKSKECYRTLFWDLIDFSDENNIYLYLQFVSTDFEQAVINAIRRNLKNCKIRIAISTYHKIYIIKYRLLVSLFLMGLMETLVY